MGLRGFFSREKRLERLKKKAEFEEAISEHRLKIAESRASVAAIKREAGPNRGMKAFNAVHEGFMKVANAAPKMEIGNGPKIDMEKRRRKK